MPRRQRKHAMVIHVTFDKPCSAAEARREVRNCIHGEFYCDDYWQRDGAPEVFKVRSFRPLPKGDSQNRDIAMAMDAAETNWGSQFARPCRLRVSADRWPMVEIDE